MEAMQPEYRARLGGLEPHLTGQLFGQAEAVGEFARTLRRCATGVGVEEGRPLSFMLLLGPTGVGKTEICLRASEFLWGNDCIARLNMAEFSDENAVQRVIGQGLHCPEDEGRLGREIAHLRRGGGRIVLLDEIEKAHPRVAKLFLGMEAARVDYGNGRSEDLSDLHFAITSNLGTAKAAQMASQGLPRTMIRQVLQTSAETFFNKEVVGRFTKFIVFEPLTREVVMRVGEKFIGRVKDAVAEHPAFAGCRISLSASVFNLIAKAGRDISLGARPMRHAAENIIGEALADFFIFRGPPEPGTSLWVVLASAVGAGTSGVAVVPENELPAGMVHDAAVAVPPLAA